jgi:carbonic anhydrase
VAWKGDAGKISINGTDYNLQHSHWHVPAEHTFNFKKYVPFAFSHRLGTGILIILISINMAF